MLSPFGDYRRFYPENETNTIQLTDRDEKIFGSIKTVLSFYQAKLAVSLSKIPWLYMQIEMIDVLILSYLSHSFSLHSEKNTKFKLT